jgi:ferredoxin
MTTDKAVVRGGSKRITYAQLSNLATELVAGATKSTEPVLNAVHASFYQLIRIVRGQDIDLPVLTQMLTQTALSCSAFSTKRKKAPSGSQFASQTTHTLVAASEATNPLCSQLTNYMPIPAVGYCKEGPTKRRRIPSSTMERNGGSTQAPVANQKQPAKCGFCKQTGHCILVCPQKRKHGKHLSHKDLSEFIKEKLSGSRARPLPHEFIGKPCLVSTSKDVMFLVLHGIYLKNPDEPEALLRDVSNLCVLVEFLTTGGSNTHDYDEICVVELQAVTNKISKLHNSKSNHATKMSKVFSKID